MIECLFKENEIENTNSEAIKFLDENLYRPDFDYHIFESCEFEEESVVFDYGYMCINDIMSGKEDHANIEHIAIGDGVLAEELTGVFVPLDNLPSWLNGKKILVLGNNVKFGAANSFLPFVSIGNDTVFGNKNVFLRFNEIGANIAIKDHNLFYENIAIGDKVTIGSNNDFFEYVTLEKNSNIGDNNTIITFAHIGVNCKLGNYNYLGARCKLSEGTTIGDHTTIGNDVFIGPNTSIGNNVVISDGANIPSNMKIGDNVVIDTSTDKCLVEKYNMVDGAEIKSNTKISI